MGADAAALAATSDGRDARRGRLLARATLVILALEPVLALAFSSTLRTVCGGWGMTPLWLFLASLALAFAAAGLSVRGAYFRVRALPAVALLLAGAALIAVPSDRLHALHASLLDVLIAGRDCDERGRPGWAGLLAVAALAVAVLCAASEGRRAVLRDAMLAAATIMTVIVLARHVLAGSGFGTFVQPPRTNAFAALLLLGLAAAIGLQRPQPSPQRWLMDTGHRRLVVRMLMVLVLFPTAVLLTDSFLSGLGMDEQVSEAMAVVVAAAIVAAMVAWYTVREERELGLRLELAASLEESHRRQELLLQNSADVVVETSPDGRITWISDTVVRALGLEPRSVTGRAFLELVHPEDRNLLRGGLRECGDGVEQCEVRLWHVDGDWPWFGVRTRAITDADGAVSARVSSLRDVSAQRQAQADLMRSEAHYRLLAENSVDVVAKFDADSRLEWVSPSVTAVLGWAPHELWGKRAEDLAHPDDADIFTRGREALQRDGITAYRLRIICKDGSYRWIGVRARAVLDASGDGAGISASLRDIEREVEAEQRLDRMARSDSLTGLMNRAEVYERIAARLAEPGTRGNATLMFCDMDNLKSLNDLHGHAAGDAVIRELAARFVGAARSGDLVARIGGDEFLLLLEGVTDIDEASALAERIRKVAELPVEFGGVRLHTTLSIGVAVARSEHDAESLVMRADRAMYAAKSAGRNRISFDAAAS